MDLSGLYVPLVTPFAPDGNVDTSALERLAAEVLDAGAAGVVALGTTGEPATLSAEERRTVVEVCAAVGRDTGTGLVVGAGTGGTAASVAAVREAARVPGVGAVLVPVPPFVRPCAEGVRAHFREIAAHSPVPVVVYDVPQRTGRALTAATLRELAALPGVVGVKHAVPALDADAVALMADPPAGVAVLCGDDVLAGPLLAIGAGGGVLASAHLATGRWVAALAAWRTAPAVTAWELTRPLARLAAALFAEPNPAVLKAVLHAQGRIASPAVRLPLLPARPGSVAAALALLTALGGEPVTAGGAGTP